MKKQKWTGCLLAAVLFFSSLFTMPACVLAEGEGNMDSGGGGFGAGTDENFWHTGDDGVRVTIVSASDGRAATSPIDLTNQRPDNIVLHFYKACKTSYRSGRALTPNTNAYLYYNPVQPLPRIITSGVPNIEQVKSYFTDEQVLRSICRITGFNYEALIGRDYKLLVEPLAYVTFQGVRTAMTATEAALYNRLLGGTMRRKMPSLSHKNLPLALFLETPDLGFPAWSGSQTTSASDDDIISSLGLGIVRFTDDITPEVEAVDYVYRVDTDVITAVTVSGGQSDPDNPVDVRFQINGTIYTVRNVYYPEGSSQLAWVKWHTPSTPQTITIRIMTSGNGTPGRTSITAKVVDLEGNDPPNPTADDRNDTYNAANAVLPDNEESTEARWSVWKTQWHPYWGWHTDWKWQNDGHDPSCPPACTVAHGHWYDAGGWKDGGWWDYELDYFSASISGNMELTTDEKSPTATATTIKSGYGVNINVYATTTAEQSMQNAYWYQTPAVTAEAINAVTRTQTAVSYFPEFYYKTYWRVLEGRASGMSTSFQFKTNPYSTYNRRTHFTPIWMKDGNYKVYTYVMDCWTPSGMLSTNLTDSVTISGDLWTDWHIAPKN